MQATGAAQTKKHAGTQAEMEIESNETDQRIKKGVHGGRVADGSLSGRGLILTLVYYTPPFS